MTQHLIVLLATMLATPVSPDADTLVLCPDFLRPALQPWVEYREGQGYQIAIETPAPTSLGVKAQIKKYANAGNLKNIVLIGDAQDHRLTSNQLVPTDYVLAKVNVKFGSEPEIATDNSYADIDGDGQVDVTIGRVPVDSTGELTQFVERVIEYESLECSGPWQQRINLVAGVGGFGPVVDKMIEQSVKQIVTDLIPACYDTTMTYGSWQSPYCPDPRRFSQTTIDRYNEGCLFWVYVGHGDRRRLDQLMLPDRRFDILDTQSVSQMTAHRGAPLALFLSCYTAAVDDPRDGLAEVMVKQRGGPIGVISSSRVSMPYAMSVFSLELLDGYFEGSAKTLGELILRAKQKMVTASSDPSKYRQLIESMGKAFSPTPELLTDERNEHVHLMHLLGDPLLRLRRPHPLKIRSDANIEAGQTVTVSGIAEHAGRLTVDLACRRDRFKRRPPRRRSYQPTAAVFSTYQDVYENAQDRIWNSLTRQVEAGPFSVTLEVPTECTGACHIRAHLTSANYFALGAEDIAVSPAVIATDDHRLKPSTPEAEPKIRR